MRKYDGENKSSLDRKSKKNKVKIVRDKRHCI